MRYGHLTGSAADSIADTLISARSCTLMQYFACDAGKTCLLGADTGLKLHAVKVRNLQTASCCWPAGNTRRGAILWRCHVLAPQAAQGSRKGVHVNKLRTDARR